MVKPSNHPHCSPSPLAKHQVQPCYHALVEVMLSDGVWSLGQMQGARAGTPVQPLAAMAALSIEAALERLPGRPLLTEWKYDGERCQAHLLGKGPTEEEDERNDGGASRVRLFSRSLDDMSERFPELLESLPVALGVMPRGHSTGAISGKAQAIGGTVDATVIASTRRSVILDAELCAVDDESGEVLPFQTLANRPRKAPTEEQLQSAPRVCLFVFDLLELDGESLLARPLAERRKLLHQVVRPVQHRVQFAESAEVSTEAELCDELERAIQAQAEGLMLKALSPGGAQRSASAAQRRGVPPIPPQPEPPKAGAQMMATAAQGSDVRHGAAMAAYEAGKRSLQWLKLKRDYIDGMGDSFDLVPVGAYMGRGRRSGAYGAYLLAAFDATSGAYQPICKLGSGLSDSELLEWSEQLSGDQMSAEEAASLLDLPQEALPPGLAPHVWLRPRVVWEVSAAEVSVSPLYRAAYGAVAEQKGLALRFPRFVRARPDKPVGEATTAAQLVSIFETQPTKSSPAPAS